MNGGRQVTGVLRGYDVFMNLSLEGAVELRKKQRDGANQEQTAEPVPMGMTVVRGNSILMIDCQDR
jgi:small nuclear ribonucleoprotein G